MERKNILVVDDDPDMRLLLGYHLNSRGYRCRCAGSVVDALRKIAEEDFDMILLDLCLERQPEDGVDLLKLLRDAAGTNPGNPPVIVLSRLNEKEIVDYTLDLGAVGYLTKPYNVDTLMDMLQEYA